MTTAWPPNKQILGTRGRVISISRDLRCSWRSDQARPSPPSPPKLSSRRSQRAARRWQRPVHQVERSPDRSGDPLARSPEARSSAPMPTEMTEPPLSTLPELLGKETGIVPRGTVPVLFRPQAILWSRVSGRLHPSNPSKSATKRYSHEKAVQRAPELAVGFFCQNCQ